MGQAASCSQGRVCENACGEQDGEQSQPPEDMEMEESEVSLFKVMAATDELEAKLVRWERSRAVQESETMPIWVESRETSLPEVQRRTARTPHAVMERAPLSSGHPFWKLPMPDDEAAEEPPESQAPQPGHEFMHVGVASRPHRGIVRPWFMRSSGQKCSSRMGSPISRALAASRSSCRRIWGRAAIFVSSVYV
mmetsp:Transcript_35027/g.69205  ORF Transcript_35027/g.69205 Transcript_35027/m.69205 type:complete len:194 (+) Transcript_35027:57-638(+)